MGVRNFEDLVVWQVAMDFAEECCRLSWRFPREERFELASQLKRSAVSVPSNIAEGQQRNGPREFIYHLGVARGSLAEATTQLRIACRLGYLTPDEVMGALQTGTRISMMTTALIQRLEGLRTTHDPRPTSRDLADQPSTAE